LAYYAINTSKQTKGEHAMLVGLPLFITMAFCFAFVLMQPHPSRRVVTAASDQSTAAANQSELTTLPMPTLPQLTPITPDPATGGSPMSDVLNSTHTATPQAGPDMDTGNLQAATANNHPSTNILQPIINQLKTTLSLPGQQKH
jgi:hypothetical protein